MKYSIIVCYRNREEHLKKFVPAIRKHFDGKEYEIIIVEQCDNFKFQRGSLLNAGAQVATGDILILHDVDYIPATPEVSYWDEKKFYSIYRPIKKVYFVNNNLQKKLPEDIPTGYRHFSSGVDDNFFGGITCIKKSKFFDINGFNPCYTGWGLEDADLRMRIEQHKLMADRSDNNEFYALDHTDSNPGQNDSGYKLNEQIYLNWKNYIRLGVRTQKYEYCYDNHSKAEFYLVDRWVDVSNCLAGDQTSITCGTYDSVVSLYKDTSEIHRVIWNGFKELVNRTPELKEHRDWVVDNQWGYGNRSLHWMWKLLFSKSPDKFNFLEIGVYKGQTISLAALLAKLYNRKIQLFGITPLSGAGDKYNQHPDINYEEAIATIFTKFNLSVDNLNLIEGFSNQQRMIDIAEQCGPYFMVYIDGCHDYDVVVSDIKNYSSMVDIGGYLVIDDASNDLKIPDGLITSNWRGLPDVTSAVNHTLSIDTRFNLIFAVGHNKVYQRILNA